MFSLSLIEQDVHLPPHLLNLPLLDAIRTELERSFLDKIVPDLGLCMSIYDIRSIDGGVVQPGEGHPIYKVTARLIMFRPFVGEIILGKIEDCDKSGLHISLGFFKDIHVPVYHLPQPCIYNETYGTWSWMCSEDNELVLAREEQVRFEVVGVRYPPIPLDNEEFKKPFAPMEIIGSIEMDGLGIPTWWGD